MKKIITAMAVVSMFGFAGIAAAGNHNPCNPCSMKSHNPCAMESQKMNPCNPCAMKMEKKKANPCDMKGHNPCGMKKMNPCNPCAGASMDDGNKPIRETAFSNFQEAADLGRRLWSDESLGTSGLSCLSCHSGYENMNFEKRQNFPHRVGMVGDVVTLDQMINYCMINPMKGEQFEKNSKELTAMAAYFRAYRMQYLRDSKK